MVAAQRQSGDDGVRGATRHDGAGGQCISHDPIVDLCVDRSFVQAYARTACSTTLHGFAKALCHIGLSPAALVLQGYEETACIGRVVAVQPARPGADVKESARRSYHVAVVANPLPQDLPPKTR